MLLVIELCLNLVTFIVSCKYNPPKKKKNYKKKLEKEKHERALY